jgi:ribosomal protein L37E
MRCPTCSAENSDDRRFCGDCATPLATACSSCGFTNQPGIRLYRHSGEPGKSGTHIETATAMYRDMNMKLWLDRT